MLSLKDVSFSYTRTPVVRSVSLSLVPGDMLGIIGPNGAGKSTLIKLMTRVLTPDGGEVTVAETPVARLSRLELSKRVAVVPQIAHLPDGYRIYDLVMMGRTPYLGFLAREGAQDHAKVQDVMRLTDTWQYRDRLASELSGGEQQRVVLARALAQEPDYLLLDEPTSHLDISYQLELIRVVKAQADKGIGVLLVLHDLNLAAQVCSALILMQRGAVVADGTPQAVLNSELLSAVYAANLSVTQLPEREAPVVLPRL